MRTKLFVSVMLAVAAALVFTACEGPAGPQGPAGPAGSPNVQTVLLAYLGSDQTIATSTFAFTTVVFDTIVVDELNGYDPSTGIYTVQTDGDYSVAFTIDWFNSFADGDDIVYSILVDSDSFVQPEVNLPGGQHAYSLSTSIPNLSAGQTIRVRLRQDSSGVKSIFGTDSPETHLSIVRLE
jgi:hypothetical protein